MSEFDFSDHSLVAVVEYLRRHGFFENLAAVVRRIIEEALKQRQIKVHSVQSRAKDASSFGAKAALPSDSDPTRPKYEKPLEQITDLAGIRVITFFPGTVSEIDEVIQQQFSVIERYNIRRRPDRRGQVWISEYPLSSSVISAALNPARISGLSRLDR